jgi:hypothetical protein
VDSVAEIERFQQKSVDRSRDHAEIALPQSRPSGARHLVVVGKHRQCGRQFASAQRNETHSFQPMQAVDPIVQTEHWEQFGRDSKIGSQFSTLQLLSKLAFRFYQQRSQLIPFIEAIAV